MSFVTEFISTGEENAISLAELCRITGMENRTLRAAIEKERQNGAVICSSVNGYFFPETRSELQKYVHREQARSCSITRSLRAAERTLKEWNRQ